MKKIIITIMIMLFSIAAFCQLNEAGRAKVKDYAKSKWGTDYEMVQYEYNVQLEACAEFFKLYDKFGCGFYSGKEEKISDECMILIEAFAKWTDENSAWVEWDMVVYEVKKQLESYNNLK